MRPDEPQLLPVHGFVLAGGQSSRMGRDKATLPFRGRPMVELAVGKLRSFCAEVSISGNRDDLSGFAPIVAEGRLHTGPVAGIESCLRACREPWALFVPVDVPLMPALLLRRWAQGVLEREQDGCGASFLTVAGQDHPAFCMLRANALPATTQAVESGERRLRNLLWALEAEGAGWLWVCNAEELAGDLLHPEYPHLQLGNWFLNVNTPDELLLAEIGNGPE